MAHLHVCWFCWNRKLENINNIPVFLLHRYMLNLQLYNPSVLSLKLLRKKKEFSKTKFFIRQICIFNNQILPKISNSKFSFLQKSCPHHYIGLLYSIIVGTLLHCKNTVSNGYMFKLKHQCNLSNVHNIFNKWLII